MATNRGTIVALHRAVYLARANPDARVLLTTFSDTLSNALRANLRRLISNEPRLGERLEVHAMDAIGRRLYEINFGRPTVPSRELIRHLLEVAAGSVDENRFSPHFLIAEWEQPSVAVQCGHVATRLITCLELF